MSVLSGLAESSPAHPKYGTAGFLRFSEHWRHVLVSKSEPLPEQQNINPRTPTPDRHPDSLDVGVKRV